MSQENEAIFKKYNRAGGNLKDLYEFLMENQLIVQDAVFKGLYSLQPLQNDKIERVVLVMAETLSKSVVIEYKKFYEYCITERKHRLSIKGDIVSLIRVGIKIGFEIIDEFMGASGSTAQGCFSNAINIMLPLIVAELDEAYFQYTKAKKNSAATVTCEDVVIQPPVADTVIANISAA